MYCTYGTFERLRPDQLALCSKCTQYRQSSLFVLRNLASAAPLREHVALPMQLGRPCHCAGSSGPDVERSIERHLESPCIRFSRET
jgi:hypothetical protein